MQDNNVSDSPAATPTINESDSVTKNDDHSDSANDTSFFDKPRNISIIMYSFYALCIILVALEFVVHRHIYLSFEKIPAFYAIYGFVACVVLVVVAKLMRLVVMRDEHYYDKREDELSSSAASTNEGQNKNNVDKPSTTAGGKSL